MLPQPNSDNELCIREPIAFFRELGDLHDADVTEFRWSPPRREISFAIADLYANFLGLPEYERLQAVRLILSGVSKVQIDVVSERPPLRVGSFEVSESGGQIHIVVMFQHDGSVQIDCDAIVCRPFPKN